MAKNKHLTDAERLQIEILLKQRCTLRKIAEQLGKSTSTISREVKKRAKEAKNLPSITHVIGVSDVENAMLSNSVLISPIVHAVAPFVVIATASAFHMKKKFASNFMNRPMSVMAAPMNIVVF